MAGLWIAVLEVKHSRESPWAEVRGGDGAFGVGIARADSAVEAEIDFARALLPMGFILVRAHRLLPFKGLPPQHAIRRDVNLHDLNLLADAMPEPRLPLFDTFFSWERKAKGSKSLARRAARDNLSLATRAA